MSLRREHIPPNVLAAAKRAGLKMPHWYVVLSVDDYARLVGQRLPIMGNVADLAPEVVEFLRHGSTGKWNGDGTRYPAPLRPRPRGRRVMIRRDADGWRDIGPLTWKVERADNHGDQSTTTTLEVVWMTRWSCDVAFTRPWKPGPEDGER